MYLLYTPVVSNDATNKVHKFVDHKYICFSASSTYFGHIGYLQGYHSNNARRNCIEKTQWGNTWKYKHATRNHCKTIHLKCFYSVFIFKQMMIFPTVFTFIKMAWLCLLRIRLTVDWRKLQNEKFRDLYFYVNSIVVDCIINSLIFSF